jgi:hypothetical protein
VKRLARSLFTHVDSDAKEQEKAFWPQKKEASFTLSRKSGGFEGVARKQYDLV